MQGLEDDFTEPAWNDLGFRVSHYPKTSLVQQPGPKKFKLSKIELIYIRPKS